MISIFIILLISAGVILSVYSLFFIKLPKCYKAISFASLALSIAAICSSSFRMTFEINDNAAFIAIVVGIIVLPTTIVLGWNIYQLIDVKNLRNELVKANNYKEELRSEIDKKIKQINSSYIIDQIALTQLVRLYDNMIEEPERLFTVALTYLNSKAFDRGLVTNLLSYEYVHQLLTVLSECYSTTKEYEDFAHRVKEQGLKKDDFYSFLNQYRTQPKNSKIEAILNKIGEIIE